MSKKEKVEKVKDVRVDKLEKNVTDIVGILGNLKKSIDSLTPKTQWSNPASETVEKKDEEKHSDMVIPPKWRTIVDEVLGKDFGLAAEFPDSGKGFSFTIIVPKDKSNAPTAHWEFYKSDWRTKQLGNSEGSDGVRKFCELVKRNLTKKIN